MMGRLKGGQAQLFYQFELDDAVPEDHLVRKIDAALDLSWLRGELAPHYSSMGRPSIDPELMIRMLVVGYVFAIRSERLICREVLVNRAYPSQLDTADRQEPTEALATKVTSLTEKLTKLKEEMGKLAVYEKQMLASPDQQISLTDPDSRSMATSGRGSGVVGYNVQVAVDTEHHLIVTHEVTNSGSDRAQLANMAKQAKAVLETETLEAVADRGYFSSLEILACHEAGITVTLPKPQTSGAKSDGRFGKQDFVYLPEEDAYRCS